MEVKEAILERRSIRFFKPDPVEEGTIRELLEAAINAPNANNAQQWYFVAIKEEGLRKRLREILIEAYLEYLQKARKDIDEKTMERVRSAISSGLYDAPLYVAVFSDLRNMMLREEYKDFEERMIVQSVSAAIQNLLLRAWDLGLGSVWLGVAKLKEGEIKDLLGISEGLTLEAVIAIGKPAKIGKKRPRKGLEEVSKIIRSLALPPFSPPPQREPLELSLPIS